MEVSGLTIAKRSVNRPQQVEIFSRTYGMPFWAEKEGQTLDTFPGVGSAGQHPAVPRALTLPRAASFLAPAQLDKQGTLWYVMFQTPKSCKEQV